MQRPAKATLRGASTSWHAGEHLHKRSVTVSLRAVPACRPQMQALAASLAPLRHAASGSSLLMPSGSLPDSLGHSHPSDGGGGGGDAAVPDAQEAHYLGELRKFVKEKGEQRLPWPPKASGPGLRRKAVWVSTWSQERTHMCYRRASMTRAGGCI